MFGSGVDESHPALQQQVSRHAFFDLHGQYKEAKYSFDRGSLGTATAGLIAAKPVCGFDLGLSTRSSIALGLCPSARLVVVNISQQGRIGDETTLVALVAGMNWAAENKRHPDWGGYELVNVPFWIRLAGCDQDVGETIDVFLGLLCFHGLAPILPGGPSDPRFGPLGTAGFYVGDSKSEPSLGHATGGRADLYSPANQFVCCQAGSGTWGMT